MLRLKFIAILSLGLFVFGCMTGPRLGFPVQSLSTPVPVTLFSAVNRKGVFIKDMDIFSRESWRLQYDKKYLDMISKVNVNQLRDQIDDLFVNKALEIKDLFTIEKKAVFHSGIDYSKNSEDSPDYSGFDFSRVANDIPTKYVLALTVNEWGYTATKKTEYT